MSRWAFRDTSPFAVWLAGLPEKLNLSLRKFHCIDASRVFREDGTYQAYLAYMWSKMQWCGVTTAPSLNWKLRVYVQIIAFCSSEMASRLVYHHDGLRGRILQAEGEVNEMTIVRTIWPRGSYKSRNTSSYLVEKTQSCMCIGQMSWHRLSTCKEDFGLQCIWAEQVDVEHNQDQKGMSLPRG